MYPFLYCMGKSFQEYSRIQGFEADFPWKVSLKMLNKANYNSFSNIFSVCLKKIDVLNLLSFCMHTCFKF